MNTTTVRNKGMKMNTTDVRELLEKKKERLAKQQLRRAKLEQTMTNTQNDIEQLEYTLQQMERAEAVPPKRISGHQALSFFERAVGIYQYFQHHFHRTLNYSWFCLAIGARYAVESHRHTSAQRILSPCTILNYFKRELDLYLTCIN